MRIALISDCYPPRTGGIESQVADLARQLAAQGHEVEVLTATLGDAGQRGGEQEREAGVLIHRLGARIPGGFPINPWVAPLAREVLGRGFDVAHAHLGVMSPFASELIDLALEAQLPVAATWHCLPDRAAGLLRAQGRARGWQQAGVALSAVSTVAAQGVRAIVGPAAEVAILPNGIDLSRWTTQTDASAVAANPPSRTEALTIVSATRLAPRKRPWQLVTMTRQIAAQVDRPVRTLVYGQGVLRPLVHALARRLKGTGAEVVFMGKVPRDELVQAYRQADLYLAPTKLEAFGIAVLEARTVGLPIVARADSGTADIVRDGTEGLLATSAAGLVDAAVRLLRDDSLRARIAQHNRTTEPRFGWRQVIAQVEVEYARAAQLAAAHRGVQ